MNSEIQTIMSDKPKHIITNPDIKAERFSAAMFFSIHKGIITSTMIGRINEMICFAMKFNSKVIALKIVMLRLFLLWDRQF